MKNDNIGREIYIKHKWNHVRKSLNRNVYIVTMWETLDIQPKEPHEEELIDINKQSGCNEKNDDTPEKLCQQKIFRLKKLFEIFQGTEVAKNIMWMLILT